MPGKNSTESKSAVDHIRLIEGPSILGHVVQHSDTQHLLIIDGVVVSCTPTEYPLLIHMLNQSEGYVAFAPLVACAFNSSLNPGTRRCLTQHMSRVRSKLWPFGLDILCITGYGYTLLPIPSKQLD